MKVNSHDRCDLCFECRSEQRRGAAVKACSLSGYKPMTPVSQRATSGCGGESWRETAPRLRSWRRSEQRRGAAVKGGCDSTARRSRQGRSEQRRGAAVKVKLAGFDSSVNVGRSEQRRGAAVKAIIGCATLLSHESRSEQRRGAAVKARSDRHAKSLDGVAASNVGVRR